MAKGDAKGDPLKSYTILMTLLVIVMAVLYFMIDGTRKDYAEANARLERDMTGQGLRRTSSGRPQTIPELAYEVERFAHTYEQAGDTGGGGISTDMMARVTTAARLKMTYDSRENREKSGNYETVKRKFEFESMSGGKPAIWQLLTLMYNIESRGRYRVSEVTWQVADENDNPTAPFDRIKKPRIEVSLRGPIRSE